MPHVSRSFKCAYANVTKEPLALLSHNKMGMSQNEKYMEQNHSQCTVQMQHKENLCKPLRLGTVCYAAKLSNN